MTKKPSPSAAFKAYNDVELIDHTQEHLPAYRKFLEEQQALLQKKETRTRGEKVKKMLAHIRTLDKYRMGIPKNFKPKDRLELEKALTFFDKLLKTEEKSRSPEKIAIVKHKNESQRKYLQALRGANDLVIGDGVAGTGKTFLAIGVAWEKFKAHKIKKIVLTRPAVTSKENIGFIPGDINAKMDPVVRPLFDALQEVSGMNAEDIEDMLATRDKLEIVPFAYMRGRTFKNAVVVLDEAQNTTPEQIRMFTTRAGEGTQVFINGDTSQNDLPIGQESGLSYLLDALNEERNTRIAIIHFAPGDVERSPLVKTLVSAYQKLEAKRSLNPTLVPKREPRRVSSQPSTVQIVADKIVVNTNSDA